MQVPTFALTPVVPVPSLDALLHGPQGPLFVAGLIGGAVLYLVALITGIVVLVKAFRVSLAWGLVSLFVPFGVLVFIAKHWEETKKLFLIQVACGGIMGALVAAVIVNGGWPPPAAKAPTNAAAAGPTPREVRDLAETEIPDPAPRVDPNAAPRAAYAKHNRELATQFQQLNAERGKLKPGSKTVAAFNAKADKYQQGLAALADEKAKLDALDRTTNLPVEAAAALASLQGAAAAGDYETFAATTKKALDDYRQTPSFPAIAALARTTLAQVTADKVAAGARDKAVRTARADFDKTTRQVQGIVNQTPAIVAAPPAGADVFHSTFHPGANPPDYKAENLLSTRELWKGQFVYMDEAPGVYYHSADCEFNPQLKAFYTNRKVPKKRLTDAEYQELTRLFHQLGQQEKALAEAVPPAGLAERVMADLMAIKPQLDSYAMK